MLKRRGKLPRLLGFSRCFPAEPGRFTPVCWREGLLGALEDSGRLWFSASGGLDVAIGSLRFRLGSLAVASA